MADLILIIGSEPGSAWEWGLTTTGQAGCVQTAAEKAELATKTFRRLIVVIPGQQVGIKLHTLGQLNDKQKYQAAGYSIEDELAASLEDCHIAIGPDDARMAVVARRVMDGLLAEMREYNLSPDIVCADYDSFEIADSFVYNNRIIQRSGNGLGFAIETELASQVLDTGQNIPPAINAERLLQKIAAALQAGHTPINLCQGIYITRDKTKLGHFKRSALLAAGIVLVFVAGNIWQGYTAGRKATQIKKQINTMYAEIFPDTEIPENPALAVIRAQSELKAGNAQEFIRLSTLLAASVQKVKGIEVVSLRYEQSRGQLTLSIQYPSFDDVERMKKAVGDNGGTFAESGTRLSGDMLSGDAILRLNP